MSRFSTLTLPRAMLPRRFLHYAAIAALRCRYDALLDY